MNIDIDGFEDTISQGMTTNNTKAIMNALRSCRIGWGENIVMLR